MSKRRDLLHSVAHTIADYRAGEIAEATPDHVDRWISQFDEAVQIPLLHEIDHVFKKTYFSKKFVTTLFANQINNTKLAGEQPCDFWRSAHMLDIQQHGRSQAEIRALFGEALHDVCNIKIDECGTDGGAFIYLDDVLFSGMRIGNDLSAWIESDAPARATVHILVIATHFLGDWQCRERLKKDAAAAGKQIKFNFWAGRRLENRLTHRNMSEVLWPTAIPEDAAVKAYIAEEKRFPFHPRQPLSQIKHAIFSSEESRQLLERELLLAGMRIRSFSQAPSPALRPLGFGAFGLGFGSMIVTFRNCPNNTPLALWWGDPNAAPGHPFRNWYPLLPRKTYGSEGDFLAIDF